jgi:hypothetical protein
MKSTHTSMCHTLCPQGVWQVAGEDFIDALGAPGEVHAHPSEISKNVTDGGGQVHLGPLLTLLLKHVLQ